LNYTRAKSIPRPDLLAVVGGGVPHSNLLHDRRIGGRLTIGRDAHLIVVVDIKRRIVRLRPGINENAVQNPAFAPLEIEHFNEDNLARVDGIIAPDQGIKEASSELFGRRIRRGHPPIFHVKSHDRRRDLRHVVLCLRFLRRIEGALDRREKQAHENPDDRHHHKQLDYREAPGGFQSTHDGMKVKPDIPRSKHFLA